MSAEPPLLAGTCQRSVTVPFPGIAEGALGAAGVCPATKVFDSPDAGLTPIAFIAITVQVYVRPAASPGTAMGLLMPVDEPTVLVSDDTHFAV